MTTPRDDIAGLIERLRISLAGVAQEESGGDNLAILLASYFEPGIEDDEMDDLRNWKQGAIDASNKVLDAIHMHYATQLDALSARVMELEARPPLLDARSIKGVDELVKTLEARALRAEQERDESYERVAIYIEQREGMIPFWRGFVAELRRLASGPEKE